MEQNVAQQDEIPMTVRTKAELIDQLEAIFVDNASHAISPQDVRSALIDVVDSAVLDFVAVATSGQASDVEYTVSGTGAIARTVSQRLGEVVSVKDFGATGSRGTDAGAAISAALAAGASFVYIPAGDYDLDTAVVAQTDAIVSASPLANFYQRDFYAVMNPVDEHVGRFTWHGGRFFYDHAVPHKFHACMALRTNNYCDLRFTATDYTDQIVAIIRPLERVNLQNSVWNRYDITTTNACRIGVWLQGLEASYTEHVGDGTTLNLATDFDVTWPSDLLIAVWEQSTGLLRRWELGTDYTISIGANGVSGPASVNPNVAVPSGDIVMMWPSHSTTPECPVSNDRYHLNIRDASDAGMYIVRYADALNISGIIRINTDGAAHIIANPVGQRNAEAGDYVHLSGLVAAQSSGVTDASTVHVLRLGPGCRKITGTILTDRAYDDGIVKSTDTRRVALTGTVTVTNGSPTMIGVGTKFDEELTTIGSVADRVWIPGSTPAQDREYAVSAVVSATEVTLASNAVISRSGVVGEKRNENDVVSYRLFADGDGLHGNDNVAVLQRKCGDYGRWTVTIPAGSTNVFAVWPHRFNKAPAQGDIVPHALGDLGGTNCWVSVPITRGVQVNIGSTLASDIDIVLTYRGSDAA